MSAVDAVARGREQQTRLRSRRLGALARQLPPRPLVRRVASSPPTITYTTTNALSAGRHWPAVKIVNAGTTYQLGGQMAALSRARAPAITQTSSPGYNYVWYKNNSFGKTGATRSSNAWQQSINFTGTRLVVWVMGFVGELLAKVNGEYVSLTPQAVVSDNASYFWDFDFGSAAQRRIDIIGTAAGVTVSPGPPFAGFFTGLGDSITPAELNGPVTAIIGDSYASGVGTTYYSFSWVTRFIDAMGWDNVIQNGIGSSGLFGNNANTYTYRERYAADIAPYNPDVVIFQGSVTDVAQTAAAVAAEALALIATAVAVNPNVLCVFTSQALTTGCSASGPNPWLKRDAMKAAVEGAGHLFLDLLEMPLPSGTVPLVAHLASAASINATTLSFTEVPLVGGFYAFANGQRVRVNSASGTGPYTATLDSPMATAQSSGATLTQVGDCPWFGNGKAGSTNNSGSCDTLVSSDGVHPTGTGHEMFGDLASNMLARKLRAV